MKIIYYNKDVQFQLTDEEFELCKSSFMQKKPVYVKRLDVLLSPYYLWAGEQPIKQLTEFTASDGTRMIKEFGVWVDANNKSIKINTQYFPELLKAVESDNHLKNI